MMSRIQVAVLALAFGSLLPSCELLYSREEMRAGAYVSWRDFGSQNTDIPSLGPGEDLGGSDVVDGDVWYEYGATRNDRSAERGIGVRISFDLANDGSEDRLEDGYVTAPIKTCPTGKLSVGAGRFKPRFFKSGYQDPEIGVFPDRTLIGQGFDWWDEGVWVDYRLDNAYAGISVTNGSDGDQNRYLFLARGEVDFGREEDPAQGTVGVTFFDDQTWPGTDGTFYGLDFSSTFGQFQLDGEVGEYGDGVSPGLRTGRDSIYHAAGLSIDPDTSPFGVTVSAELDARWAVGVRFENLENATEDQIVGVAGRYKPHKAVNWYVSASQISSDLDTRDGTLFTWGFSWGQSGSF